MNKENSKRGKLSDTRIIARAHDVLAGKKQKNRLTRLMPFLGPAFIASVAYVDPGNFATNIQAGAQFGYMLLWVIIASNLMAMLIQTLSAKLGLATGMNLAEHCRRSFSRPVVICMWLLMEIVAMATDLAEFLGAALGFHLLLGVPIFFGAVLTGIFNSCDSRQSPFVECGRRHDQHRGIYETCNSHRNEYIRYLEPIQGPQLRFVLDDNSALGQGRMQKNGMRHYRRAEYAGGKEDALRPGEPGHDGVVENFTPVGPHYDCFHQITHCNSAYHR